MVAGLPGLGIDVAEMKAGGGFGGAIDRLRHKRARQPAASLLFTVRTVDLGEHFIPLFLHLLDPLQRPFLDQ